MIVVEAVQVVVYRSAVGRRKRFTAKAAYLDAAWQAWRAKYPCQCEEETGFVCGNHLRHVNTSASEAAGEIVEGGYAIGPYRKKVIDRLARWLRWRDRVLAAECAAAAED